MREWKYLLAAVVLTVNWSAVAITDLRWHLQIRWWQLLYQMSCTNERCHLKIRGCQLLIRKKNCQNRPPNFFACGSRFYLGTITQLFMRNKSNFTILLMLTHENGSFCVNFFNVHNLPIPDCTFSMRKPFSWNPGWLNCWSWNREEGALNQNGTYGTENLPTNTLFLSNAH